MINKIYGIFIVLFLSANIFLQAQDITSESLQNIVYLPHTELINKKITDSPDNFSGLYEYRTELSKEEIVKFYRDYFSSLNLREEISKDEGKMFHFKKGMIDNALLNIYYTDEQNITYYLLDILHEKYVIAISNLKYTKPQGIDFAPVNYDYTQTILRESSRKHKYVQYLTSGDVEKIAEFYLKNMGSFNWTLSDRQDYEGNSNIVEIFSRGFDNPKKKDLPQLVAPDVNATVKSITLIFKNKDSNCVVSIIQFQDPPEILKSARIINPDILAKYGDILIGVECGYQNELEKVTE